MHCGQTDEKKKITHYGSLYNALTIQSSKKLKRCLCDSDDFWYVEISCNRRQSFADQIRLIRLESMHLMPVLLRVDGYTAYSHLSARTEHTNSYLTCMFTLIVQSSAAATVLCPSCNVNMFKKYA